MPDQVTSQRLQLRSRVSRRMIIGTGLGAIAAPAVLRIIPANAQSKVIKIGHVSPRTGALAGFGEADGFILEQVRGILSRGLQSGGRTYQVQIISKDSQSSGSRASEVASAADPRRQGRSHRGVGHSRHHQPGRRPGRGQRRTLRHHRLSRGSHISSAARAIRPKASTWTYHFFWGLEACHRRVPRAVGQRDQRIRSSALCFRTTPTAMPGAIRSAACLRALAQAGYKLTDPGRYQP